MIKRIISIMVALALITYSLIMPTFADETSPSNPNKLSISGSGDMLVKSDIVSFQVGYEAQNKIAAVAQNEAKTKMVAIMKAFKALGVKDEDIKAGTVSVNNVSQGKNKFSVVVNRVEVTYRNVDRLGTLVDSLVKAGANNFGVFKFSSENPESYQILAKPWAIKKVDDIANAVAAIKDIVISKPSRVSIRLLHSEPYKYISYDAIKSLPVAAYGNLVYEIYFEVEYQF